MSCVLVSAFLGVTSPIPFPVGSPILCICCWTLRFILHQVWDGKQKEGREKGGCPLLTRAGCLQLVLAMRKAAVQASTAAAWFCRNQWIWGFQIRWKKGRQKWVWRRQQKAAIQPVHCELSGDNAVLHSLDPYQTYLQITWQSVVRIFGTSHFLFPFSTPVHKQHRYVGWWEPSGVIFSYCRCLRHLSLPLACSVLLEIETHAFLPVVRPHAFRYFEICML